MQGTILSILTFIQTVLPLATQAGSAAGAIANAVTVLQKLLPYIVGEIEAVYQPFKNVLDLLKNSGDVTPAQLATLQQLDVQADTAFEAVAVQIDPDAAPAA